MDIAVIIVIDALLALREGNPQWLVDPPHKGPVIQKAFLCH